MKRIRINLSTGVLLATLALAAMTQATAQEYTFTTLAGLAGNSGSADGTGSAARFWLPAGVTLDSGSNLYVADCCNDTVRKVTPAGVVTTLAGLPGVAGANDGTGSAAQFFTPGGVAVDSAGNVYVADTGNNTIRKVTPGGVVTTLAGLAGTRGSADGTGSAARFWDPLAVAVDSAGNVYVSDAENGAIRLVTPAGVVTTVLHPGWNIAGVAVDSAGNVYVADFGDATILKATPDGVVTTLAAGLNEPYGVAVDSAGNVYVTDNDTIQKVTPGGAVTTRAGLAGNSGSADGTGSTARFNDPFGVALDSAGDLYVADTGNNTIRIGIVACPDQPTIDLAAGPVGQMRQLDTSPQTAVAWQWSLIQSPAASSAALSAANIRNPTFTPDVTGSYVFQLEATYASGAVCNSTLAFTALPPPPSILTPPLTHTAEMGSLACFWTEVTNTPPAPTYQWYFNGTNALVGATNSYLDLANVQPARAGAYTVVVTNLYGAVTSAPALLSVIPPVERTIVPAAGLPGGAASLLHVEYADSLVAPPRWFSLTNVTPSRGPQLCFDLSQPLPEQRFYRAWQTNGPPPVLAMSLATEIPLTGTIGSSVQIDYINQFGPTNAWVTLDTVTLSNTTQLYFDVTMFRRPTRLYRLVAAP